MFNTLKKLKDSNKEADFLFPSLTKAIKGNVTNLTQDRVVIEFRIDGDVYQVIGHPNNTIIIQKKAS